MKPPTKPIIRLRLCPWLGEDPKKNEDFLVLYERQCIAFKIPESEWLTHLIPHLKDKAREALAHIDRNITSYEVVKQHLINSFIHSSDYYRVQFHQHNLTDKVEPWVYVSDVKTFLVTWLELLKVDIKNPNEICHAQ